MSDNPFEDLLKKNKEIGSDFLKDYKLSGTLPKADELNVPFLSKGNNPTKLEAILEENNEGSVVGKPEPHKPKKRSERFLNVPKQGKHVTFVDKEKETEKTKQQSILF